MENIIITEEMLSRPEYLFTEECAKECAERYADFIEKAAKWGDEE